VTVCGTLHNIIVHIGLGPMLKSLVIVSRRNAVYSQCVSLC